MKNSIFQPSKSKSSPTEFCQPRRSGYQTLPKDKCKNDYSIILVHGFCGWVPDESPIFGNYFRYADDPEVR